MKKIIYFTLPFLIIYGNINAQNIEITPVKENISYTSLDSEGYYSFLIKDSLAYIIGTNDTYQNFLKLKLNGDTIIDKSYLIENEPYYDNSEIFSINDTIISSYSRSIIKYNENGEILDELNLTNTDVLFENNIWYVVGKYAVISGQSLSNLDTILNIDFGTGFSKVCISNSSILLGGYTNYSDIDGSEPYLLKLNNEHDTTWSKIYRDLNREYIENILEVEDGNLLLGLDNAILKVNSHGDTLWYKELDNSPSIETLLRINEDEYLVLTNLRYNYPHIKQAKLYRLSKDGKFIDEILLGDTSSTVYLNKAFDLVQVNKNTFMCVLITYNNNSTYNISMVEISFDIPNNIESTEKTSINFFPNPVKNYLNLVNCKDLIGNAQYSVIDGSGRVLLTKELDNNQIDMSSFQRGIYFIQIGNNDKIQSIKVLKD
jgi:hypothetical protein